jgi:RND family efflux transporter MFP subunit
MSTWNRLRHPALLLLVPLAACQPSGPAAEAQGNPVRTVLTVALQPAAGHDARLSGSVRARYETPVSFQVGGRIQARHVDAGERVSAGALLFELDPRDFRQAIRIAEADLAAARAELATAEAETARNRDLLARRFIGQQIFDQVLLAEASASERVAAAAARVQQARNALAYTRLEAAHAGTLIEVGGEPGQVVTSGQAVAVLAQEGEHEVEVYLPEPLGVPASGEVVDGEQRLAGLRLRAVAGAAEPVTRTWQARYSIEQATAPLRLGSVVRVQLQADAAGEGRALQVPVGAISERGDGAKVWQVIDGRAEPVAVRLLDMNEETARIIADLPAEARIIALGTHLLKAGMPVREQQR